MLRCEIQRNIVNQTVDVYLIDGDIYFTYDNGGVQAHKRKNYVVDGVKPYLSINYDIWNALIEAFKKELNVEKIEGSSSHIKDLRWVLTHFMDKDKK